MADIQIAPDADVKGLKVLQEIELENLKKIIEI